MTRTVSEWIGATPDTAIPARVKVRVFDRQSGECAKCARPFRGKDAAPEYDHITALVNGGENRETNLQALCSWCHKDKTGHDVAEKATVYRKKAKAIGAKKPRNPLPGSRGSALKRKVSGEVVRREAD